MVEAAAAADGGEWERRRGRVSEMRSKTLAHDCLIKLTGTTLGRGR
jgi:hypothetical protein